MFGFFFHVEEIYKTAAPKAGGNAEGYWEQHAEKFPLPEESC